MYMYVNKRVELSQRGNSALENLCIIIIIVDVLSPVNHVVVLYMGKTRGGSYHCVV